MPVTKTSRWLTGGRTNLIGTSLGSPGAGELPNSAMYWAAQTPGWPSSDLANYNQMKALWGRKPDVVRVYSTNAEATTGHTGSAGAYGFITDDWRQIANDGCLLSVSFIHNGGNNQWIVDANALNAASPSPAQVTIQQDYLNMIQNLKRWHDDTGNTFPTKSIMLGTQHEPSKQTSPGTEYVQYTQAVVNFFLDHGIGTGPKPSTGHGSSYAGTWYDMVEWMHVAIGFDTRSSAGEYAYYPGDGFVTWMMFDVYNWAGGQVIGAGGAQTDAQLGKVPQVGRTITDGHYTDAWKALQQVMDNPRSWYEAGPGGFRNVLMGMGEFACSEDIDRFTISGGSLANPQTHTGIPHLKGDWFEGVRKWLRGETWTAPNAVNNIVSTGLYFGPLIKVPIYWNSQAAGPRWWNTIPFQPGDTTGPSTAGAGAHYTFDKVVTLVNDDIFSTGPSSHVAPTITSLLANPVEGGDPLNWDFIVNVVAGDSAIVSYLWNFGDGGGTVTDTTAALTDEQIHLYGHGGRFSVTVTVTDANGLTVVGTVSIVVSPPLTTYALAPYIQPNDIIADLRFTYNPALDALEGYTRSRVGHLGVKHTAVTWTNQPAAVTQFNGGATLRQYVDLSGFTLIKTVCNLSAAGFAGAKLAPAYSIDGGTTWKFFDQQATSGTTVASSLLGATCNADTATFHQGSYAPIPTEAQIDGVLITFYGAGGDATADPTYESIGLRLR